MHEALIVSPTEYGTLTVSQTYCTFFMYIKQSKVFCNSRICKLLKLYEKNQ